ncbi:hypothetical protein IMAU60211_00766 [Lactobacillus helveticus]|nr:hypothetical protein [Lactobacillus helveticus]
MEKYHRAFGVYGIIYSENKGLVVIKKMEDLILIDLIYPGVVWKMGKN